MNEITVNKKSYFFNHNQTFDEFVKHVEATKNNQTDTGQTDSIVHEIVENVRKKIDKNKGWGRLKGNI